MARDEVIEFFEMKAARYEDIEEPLYWQFADTLLAWLLDEHVYDHLDGPFRLLDAGGGRGTWLVSALQANPESSGMLVDISPAMVEKAQEGVRDAGLDERVDFVEGDLHDVSAMVDQHFDIVYALHNVLGFVERPQEVVSNLYDRLEPGGRFVCDVPNLYHGAYFNTQLGNVEDASRLAETGRGTYSDGMPELHFYTPERLAGILTEAGFSDVETYGFPVSVYPGLDEAHLQGNTDSLDDLLGQGPTHETLLETEKRLVSRPEAAARGSGLFAVGVK